MKNQNKKNTTIKTECFCIQEHEGINKVLATVNARGMAKLLDVVGLAANPRKAKRNKTLTAICDTLRTSPKEMKFRSKGLLVSTSHCIQRERGRFELTFEDDRYEGVLDGGHNMLAVGLVILEEYSDKNPSLEINTNKIRDWDTFLEIWGQYKDKLEDTLKDFEFEIPVEIIYPSDQTESVDFDEKIFEISDARNNNSPLTAGTKAHHKGYYEMLKEVLDPAIKDEIEWKDGDVKRIKRDDIVAMSLIPLLALQKENRLESSLPMINPINLYSGKGKCVETFTTIYEKHSDDNGKVKDELFKSAISLLRDLPKLYDLIYQRFPDAYNGHSPGGFGKINCVQNYINSTRKTPSKYYKDECNYKYPDGFIIPIFCGLSKLMEVKGNKLEWKVDPEKFLIDNLEEGVELLVSTIKENGYNPNQVGKSKGAYDGVALAFNYLLSS